MKKLLIFLVCLIPGFVLAQDISFGQDNGQLDTTSKTTETQRSRQSFPPPRESETVEGVIKAAELVLTGQVGNSTSSSSFHVVSGNTATKNDVNKIVAKIAKLDKKLSDLLANGASKEDIDDLKSDIAKLRENTLSSDQLQEQLDQLGDRLKEAGFANVNSIAAEEAAEKDRAAKAAQNSAIVEEKNKDMENTLFVVLLVGLATAGLVAFFYLLFTRPRADAKKVDSSTATGDGADDQSAFALREALEREIQPGTHISGRFSGTTKDGIRFFAHYERKK